MPPHSGDKPKVIVNPQSSKIIAYKMVDERASINFRILASFKKGGKKLSKQSKNKGKRHARYDSPSHLPLLGGSRRGRAGRFGSRSQGVLILPHLADARASSLRFPPSYLNNFYQR